MKMIVGLGNPGRRYQKTRHNFGFIVIDALAKNLKLKINHKDYSVRWGRVILGKKTVILAKPNTYVNLSGQAVSQLVRKFHPKLKDLLVVLDDVNLPWGKLRFRPRGTAGGHNGLKSIIEILGTNEFPRLRLGVSGGKKKELSNYVLAEFNQSQKKDTKVLLGHINQGIKVFIKDGIVSAMNRFNRINILDNL